MIRDLPRSIQTQFAAYAEVLKQPAKQRIPACIGGSIALAAYVGVSRGTKDLDLYVKREDAESLISAVNALGFIDSYERTPYDRAWIYRAVKDGFIVDIIWQMANQRAQVNDAWLNRGPRIEIAGETLSVMPVEELIWSKLYVLQHDRCDWPDILNLLDCTIEQIDWEHLMGQVADDAPLLLSALQIYQWLRPERAMQLPERLRAGNSFNEASADVTRKRAALLDSRDWFNGSVQERDKKC
jgi:hypothetical protein